ncbi:MAG: septal ring lytic transglycosylase RlpA family protein [Nitrospira sp.]|nr:septal ring lytic transglycosylase RlpA family protein [Nitrospira sp.]
MPSAEHLQTDSLRENTAYRFVLREQTTSSSESETTEGVIKGAQSLKDEHIRQGALPNRLESALPGPQWQGRRLGQTGQLGRLWWAGTVTTFVVGAHLVLGACSWMPTGESQLDVGIKERGVASWYGASFHGKVMASGERFDMKALTAAHRTLPIGSMVRVVNLLNGTHVRVRITDRGPYVAGRILDLSYAAAVRLEMVEAGVAVIQLEVIGDHRPDFVLDAEERRWSGPLFLPLSDGDPLFQVMEGQPAWRKSRSPSKEASFILRPDLLWDRRRIDGTAAFPVDVAYRTAATLLL